MSDDDMLGRFKPPVNSNGRDAARRWTIDLGEDERALIVRLCGELRGLLTAADDDPNAPLSPILQRLFPPAFHDDAEKEAEYQRLMREELVTSRLVQLDAVTSALGPEAPKLLDEGQIIAFMQSINAVRVVLGTMLDVGEEDDEIEPDDASSEHQLYGFLSWLLDWTVKSLSG